MTAPAEREAYEAAAERHAEAWAALGRARHVLELAEVELEAAAVELAAHEASPGIPLYTQRPAP